MVPQVLAIVGSPRKGKTSGVVQKFELELKRLGEIEFQIVMLKDLKIGNCRGCGLCLEKGEEFCPLKDDFNDLFARMQKADAIIMATPVYALQVTALLKNLLDRMAFVMHRPCFYHKLFMPIVTQGVYGADGVIKYLDEAAKFCGFTSCPGLGLTVAFKDPLPEETRKEDAEIKLAAERFCNLLNNRVDPIPSIKDVLIFRMVRSTHKQAAGLPRDHQYYRDQGWLEADYYYPTKLNLLKKMVGRWADWQGSKMAAQAKQEREEYQLQKQHNEEK